MVRVKGETMHVTKHRSSTSSLRPLVADDVIAALEPGVREHPDFHDGWSHIRLRVAPFTREQSSRDPSILVTDRDADRLERVIARHRGTRSVGDLRRALARAAIIDAWSIPKDVVTMNSRVVCVDERTGVEREVQLVYPHDSCGCGSRVVVLTPFGAELLGLSTGASTSGLAARLRWRVRTLTYQPEREGHFHL